MGCSDGCESDDEEEEEEEEGDEGVDLELSALPGSVDSEIVGPSDGSFNGFFSSGCLDWYHSTFSSRYFAIASTFFSPSKERDKVCALGESLFLVLSGSSFEG
jgi:hypothetical protein